MQPDKPPERSNHALAIVIALALILLVGLELEIARRTFSAPESVTQIGAVTPSRAEAGKSEHGKAPEATKTQVAAKTPEDAKSSEADAAIAQLKAITDHQTAKWHPIHFKPEIDKATNEQCLTCHQEILTRKVRPASPAGLEASSSKAWYQTLDTYAGEQDTFHARHLTSPFAKQVMNLSCTFCHQGHDPREEAPRATATAAPAAFTLRKTVDPSRTCLLCHGSFPAENMGLEKAPWHKQRENLESADAQNGCLVCHAEQFRTVRHQVSYLKADAIEASAKDGTSDTCFGCHGGRAWYRTSYPYPRHPWPGMDKTVPDWAKDRPTKSDPRYAIK